MLGMQNKYCKCKGQRSQSSTLTSSAVECNIFFKKSFMPRSYQFKQLVVDQLFKPPGPGLQLASKVELYFSPHVNGVCIVAAKKMDHLMFWVIEDDEKGQ